MTGLAFSRIVKQTEHPENGLGFKQKYTFSGTKNDLEGNGGAIASDNRDPQFESSHWRILFTLNYV